MPKKKENPEKEKLKKTKPEEDILKEDVVWKKTDGENAYLETNIDKFYDLVKKKQSMNFEAAAREFGVDKKQIASWAKILEEHKLVAVHYPLHGDPSIIYRQEEGKKMMKEEEGKKKRPGKKSPKILVVLAGGLMVLLGYVMAVSNPFTITIRSQIAAFFGRMTMSFLPYPLNIITPFAIIIVVAWALLAFKHRKKSSKKVIESKLSKIKKELES